MGVSVCSARGCARRVWWGVSVVCVTYGVWYVWEGVCGVYNGQCISVCVVWYDCVSVCDAYGRVWHESLVCV